MEHQLVQNLMGAGSPVKDVADDVEAVHRDLLDQVAEVGNQALPDARVHGGGDQLPVIVGFRRVLGGAHQFPDHKAEFVAAIILLPFLILASTDKIFTGLLANLSWGNVLVIIIRLFLVLGFMALVIKGLVKPTKNSVILLTSLSVPVINTFLFCVAAVSIFSGKILPMANAAGQNIVYFLIFGFIGWNFFLEFGLNALLASAFHNAYKSIENNFSRKGK